MTRSYNPLEHARNTATGKWPGFSYPQHPDNPIPWHPSDEDAAYRMVPTIMRRDSEDTIEHLKEHGEFNFYNGSTRPDWSGKVGGVFLNEAKPTDPVFTVSRSTGRRNLTVKTGYTSPWGAKVRIGKDMVIQGYPMASYSDCKLHVYDPMENTITEIQYLENVKANPLLNAVFSFFSWLFRRPTSDYTCHGVRQIDLNADSTEARGSSVANMPISTMTITYKNFQVNEPQMSTMAVTCADHYNEMWPAEDSDGPVGAPPNWFNSMPADTRSIKMGEILRLKETAYLEIQADPTFGPQAKFVAECWYIYGIMVVDTGGRHSTGVDVDARWDHEDLSALSQVDLDDFTVWQLTPPED